MPRGPVVRSRMGILIRRGLVYGAMTGMAAGLFLLPLVDESPTGKIMFWRNVILAGAGFGALTGAALGLRPQDAGERNIPTNPAGCDTPAAATDRTGDEC